MATGLQQVLRSLCSGTVWTYAVFWRLKPRPHMVLTWDDAYYDDSGKAKLSQVKCSTKVVDHYDDGLRDLHQPLGLALAKLSCYGYSFGEGIIGQVAISGKHKWIYFDDHVNISYSSPEDLDAWQIQVLAGIKTVFVVAVPYGVVQLGSLQKVDEDMQLVTDIRDAFHSLQDASVQDQSSCMPFGVDSLLHDCSSKLPYTEKQIDGPSVLPECGFSPRPVVNVFSDSQELKNSKHDKKFELLEAISSIANMEIHKEVDVKQHNVTNAEGETSSLGHRCSVLDSNLRPYIQKSVVEDFMMSDVSLPAEAFAFDLPCNPSGLSNSSSCDGLCAAVLDSNGSRSSRIPESSKELRKDQVKEMEIEVGFSSEDMSSTSLRFSTISELHEALGPAFQDKRNPSDSEKQKTRESRSVKALDEINISQFTRELGSDHLLEAVVAKACHASFDDKSEKSSSESRDHLVSISTSEPASFSKLTISEGYAIDRRSHMEEVGLQSSERSFGMSPSAISSAYPSSGVEMVRRSSDTAKNSKKKSRPGDNRRPRPRDRQLIQDRLKELRELVPNGSKCSIDSLLEQTIKHLLFLQSITKHTDMLNQYTGSKVRHRKMGRMGSPNCEQGSSWAVEVGSPLKVQSIMVENLPKIGQLLVEMMCEDCSHFLEIAEAMRSLGLTILKGATEAHGDTIWICFVIEGQNHINLHRMDILWSLVQVLQLKASSEECPLQP